MTSGHQIPKSLTSFSWETKDDIELINSQRSSKPVPIPIGFFLPHFDIGGIERVVLNLLLHMDRRKFSPVLILQKRRGLLLSQVPEDVPLLDLGGRPISRLIPRLIHCLTQNRIKVLYSGTNAVNIIALSASLLMSQKLTVIVSEHTAPSQYLLQAKWQRLRIAGMRLLYPRAAQIAVPLKEIGEELKQILGFSSLPITVLHNPVIDITKEKGADKTHPFFWPQTQGPVFISMGRLVSEKGFDSLIYAFYKLKITHSDAHLLILGEGPERIQLEDLVDKLNLNNSVSLVGSVIDPMSFIRNATAFVLSSRREGFGNVLIEAMACGTPVIAVDCPVGPRVVLQEGRAGLLVLPDDPEALAEAMKNIITDQNLSTSFRVHGLRRALDFDIQKTVPAFENLFEKLTIN